EAAVGAASGTMVIFAFLGNVFIPLSGALLAFAKFTPLYGYAALARYPLTEGYLPDGSQDPLWVPIVNVLAWLAIFGTAAVLLVRRGRERQ
ncbi:MAG: ABC transporter permease, partial [Terrabacter sp.]|nr:ABC transporter permease [Terrabacter sp.]